MLTALRVKIRAWWRRLLLLDLEERTAQRVKAARQRSRQLEAECELLWDGVFLLSGYYARQRRWRDGGSFVTDASGRAFYVKNNEVPPTFRTHK